MSAMRTPLLCSLLLLTATTVRAAEPAETPELRGVWLQPYAMTAETLPASLDKIKQLRLNTVFIRTPPIETPTVTHHGRADRADFEAAVKALTDRGISVHAWITNKWRAGNDQADFTDPAERAHQAAWAVAILKRYPTLDGVHLDYIRYTKWGPPVAAKMNVVTQTVADIRTAMRKHDPRAKLTAAVFTADYSYVGGTWNPAGKPAWDGDVPQWYRDWYLKHPDNLFIKRPTAQHAAGKFKDFHAKHLYGPTFFHLQQDPVTWLKRDLLDAVLVMQYTADRDRWQTEARAWRALVGDERIARVHLGLGWLTERGHQDWKRDAPAMADHVRYARTQKIGGTSIFTLGVANTDDTPLIKALAGDDGPFAKPAVSPLRK